MNTKTYDFSQMTGPQLVEAYNEMCATATDLGVQTAQPVKRFSGLDAGRTRCEKMHALVQELAAARSAPADASRPQGVAPAAGEPLAPAAEPDLRPSNLRHSDQPDAPPASGASDVTDISWNEMTGGDLSDGDDDMAKKAKAKKAGKPRAKKGDGEGLASYTKRWNDLVPKAVKAGIKGVKHHTSDFESYEKAKARVAWLEKAISKA
jgi:hypothetical protein